MLIWTLNKHGMRVGNGCVFIFDTFFFLENVLIFFDSVKGMEIACRAKEMSVSGE